MKKILSIMACFMFVLVGGIALSACGNGNKITKEQLIDYLSGDGVVSEFDGYELNSVIGNMEINATVVSNGETLNAKIVYPGALQSSRNGTIYIKDNVVYFTTAEHKYYMGIDNYNEAVDNINDIINYDGDLTDSIISFVNGGIDGKLTITKKSNGENVAFKLSNTLEVGENKTISTVELKYTSNKLKSFSLITISHDVVITNISLNEFVGNIDFPDFSDYEAFSNVETVDLEEVNNYLNKLNSTWTSYEVFDGICQNVKYDAKVSLVDEKLQVEVIAENGFKIYLKDNVVYFDNGTKKIKAKFNGLGYFDVDDVNFGEAYDFISSAVVVEDDVNSVFNSTFITGELKYVEEMVSSGYCKAKIEMSKDADLTTFVISLSYGDETSSRTLMFDATKLLEYSAETVDGITSFVYSNVAIEFPDLSEYVEVV